MKLLDHEALEALAQAHFAQNPNDANCFVAEDGNVFGVAGEGYARHHSREVGVGYEKFDNPAAEAGPEAGQALEPKTGLVGQLSQEDLAALAQAAQGAEALQDPTAAGDAHTGETVAPLGDDGAASGQEGEPKPEAQMPDAEEAKPADANALEVEPAPAKQAGKKKKTASAGA